MKTKSTGLTFNTQLGTPAARAGGERAGSPLPVGESTRSSARYGATQRLPQLAASPASFQAGPFSLPGAPYPAPPPGAPRSGPGRGGGLEGRVRDDWASSEPSGGEGRCEVTHSLGNNRTDKLQGTRRSQARICGRSRPDVPGGPGGSESTPRASKGRFLKRKQKRRQLVSLWPGVLLPRLGLLPLLLPCPRPAGPGPAEQ